MYKYGPEEFLQTLVAALLILSGIFSSFVKLKSSDGQVNRRGFILIFITILSGIGTIVLIFTQANSKFEEKSIAEKNRFQDSINSLNRYISLMDTVSTNLEKSTGALNAATEALGKLDTLQGQAINILNSSDSILFSQIQLLKNAQRSIAPFFPIHFCLIAEIPLSDKKIYKLMNRFEKIRDSIESGKTFDSKRIRATFSSSNPNKVSVIEIEDFIKWDETFFINSFYVGFSPYYTVNWDKDEFAESSLTILRFDRETKELIPSSKKAFSIATVSFEAKKIFLKIYLTTYYITAPRKPDFISQKDLIGSYFFINWGYSDSVAFDHTSFSFGHDFSESIEVNPAKSVNVTPLIFRNRNMYFLRKIEDKNFSRAFIYNLIMGNY